MPGRFGICIGIIHRTRNDRVAKVLSPGRRWIMNPSVYLEYKYTIIIVICIGYVVDNIICKKFSVNLYTWLIMIYVLGRLLV